MNKPAQAELTSQLLRCVAQARSQSGQSEVTSISANTLFSDLLDSMAMVEFLLLVAQKCATTPEALEACAGHQFGTVMDLAAAMNGAGLFFQGSNLSDSPILAGESVAPALAQVWLSAAAARLPQQMEAASEINRRLGRPPGWLETRAGIGHRYVWREQDPLLAAADAARACLAQARIGVESVGALLVSSEAPPLLVGLAAVLHDQIGLQSHTVALEVGGACAGSIAALWLAQSLVPRVGTILTIAIEAPSQYLEIQPGPAGEAAALFGDGVATCVLTRNPSGSDAVPLRDVRFRAAGRDRALIQITCDPRGPVQLRLQGEALARRAIRTMAEIVRELTRQHDLQLADLEAVLIHGGNGRFAEMVARQLNLGSERVWSETARTGNLGSASLPFAWAVRHPKPKGPVVWTAVGAGLTWGGALTGTAAT
jgi:3-oxoacyl-[acyl-carrier-protein] synthase-3